MVHFEAITEENFSAVIQMKRPPDEHFAAPNAYSLTQAVKDIIRMAKESGKYDFLLLDCAPDNHIARHVYEKLGFCPTGVLHDGEIELKLEL